MEWLEIVVHTTSPAQELVSEVLINNGVSGTSILDRAYVPDVTKMGKEWELYDPSLLEQMPQDVEVHAWLEMNENLQASLALIAEDLAYLKKGKYEFSLGTLQIETKNVNDEDWKDTWKKYFKPLRIGKHIVVKPSWETYHKQHGDVIIELDPGMAFGTGAHATTYMCLELLEEFVQPHSTVIDIGTGSGILAVACGLLCAKDILGVDINSDAVAVAKENVEKNGLEACIEIRQSDLLEIVNQKYDIAVANIIADAILFLTPSVKNVLNDNATYIVSGILKERAEEIIQNATECGFELLKRLDKDEWVGLAFAYRA